MKKEKPLESARRPACGNVDKASALTTVPQENKTEEADFDVPPNPAKLISYRHRRGFDPSTAIRSLVEPSGKRVADIGCGGGIYSAAWGGPQNAKEGGMERPNAGHMAGDGDDGALRGSLAAPDRNFREMALASAAAPSHVIGQRAHQLY